MSQPTLKWYDCTGNDATGNPWILTGTGNDDLSKFMTTSESGTCPRGQLLTSSLRFDWSNPGLWSTPRVLVLEFTGDQTDSTHQAAQGISLQVYDPDNGTPAQTIVSNLETIMASSLDSEHMWSARFGLSAHYLDPTDTTTNPAFTQEAIATTNTPLSGSTANSTVWQALPYTNVSGMFDTLVQSKTGNDGSNTLNTNLMRKHISTSPVKWMLNWYLYVTFKPGTMAEAGEQSGFGIRANAAWPGHLVS